MKLQTDIDEGVNKFSPSAIRELVNSGSQRKLLNEAYQQLSPRQKQLFHKKFSKIFRDETYRGNSDIWKVNFAGATILMPLKKKRMWLDWDSALSIIGHDIEVKQTYEALVSSSRPPDFFIDIGANYGTHSLLFLVHQIETLTFEPNASCYAVFNESCEINNVSPKTEGVALGAQSGQTKLTYPKYRTWNGSTNTTVAENLSAKDKTRTDIVVQKKLDDYLSQIKGKQTLIKIDTEGNELSVLRGAKKTLDETKPMIIFESFGEGERSELYQFLEKRNYNIYKLPWDAEKNNLSLGTDEFLADNSSNFIAVS